FILCIKTRTTLTTNTGSILTLQGEGKAQEADNIELSPTPRREQSSAATPRQKLADGNRRRLTVRPERHLQKLRRDQAGPCRGYGTALRWTRHQATGRGADLCE